MSLRSSNSKQQSPSVAWGNSPSKPPSRISGDASAGILTRSKPPVPQSTQSTTEFSKNLRNLQQQSNESLEDEYIKNLQQQIAYQELELKLLKEKELEQKQSVGQIDKFFNDGVPLNENILALKNQYTHIKRTLENRIDELNEQRLEEIRHAAELKAYYEKQSGTLKTINDAIQKKEKDFSETMNDLRMTYLNEKHRRVQAEADFKKMQIQLKQTNDENLKMTRDLERENILVHHKEDTLKNARKKTLDDLKSKDQWLTQLEAEVIKKRSEATFNPVVDMLENENLDLSSKLLMLEKEINMALNRVKETEMFLELRSKERESEAEMKRELILKISQFKFQIEEQNKMNEIEIQKKVEAKEAKDRKDLEKELDEVKRTKTLTKQRQHEKEDHLKEMAQDRVGLQQDIMAVELENESLEKDIKEKKEMLLKLKNSREALTLEEQDLSTKLKPVLRDIDSIRSVIPQIEENNLHLKEQIAHMEKLNELSVQIKNVNLEELKLLTTSNDQVNTTITDLMRKWTTIQSVNPGKGGF